LYDLLSEEIKQKGFEAMVADECAWLGTVRYTLEPKTNFLKPGDLRNLSDWQAFVLNEIFRLRDKIAEKKNKPAYMIMPEDSVRRLADKSLDYSNTAAIPGLHPSLRHGNAAIELKHNIEAIFESAENSKLPRKINRDWPSEEERVQYYERKRMQVQLRDKVFEPIQKRLSERMGPFAARYILSNGWITKWYAGEVKWADIQPGYKVSLIRNIAQELGISLSEIDAYERLWQIPASKYFAGKTT